jgi:hypothetical protein
VVEARIPIAIGTEAEKLIFPAQKERPKEAPFWAWKNSFSAVPIVIGMKRMTRSSSKKIKFV